MQRGNDTMLPSVSFADNGGGAGNFGTVAPVYMQPVQPATVAQHEEVEDSLSITDMEKDLIMKALKKHRGPPPRCRF